MTCAEFQARWQTAVERRDAAALTQLRSHGESCGSPECGRLWQEEQLLSRAVAEWRQFPSLPPADLVNRVLAVVTEHQSVASRSVPGRAVVVRDHRPVPTSMSSKSWHANTSDSPAGSAGRWAAITAAVGVLLAVALFVRSSSTPDGLVRDDPSRRPVPEVTAPEVTPGLPGDRPQVHLADANSVPPSEETPDSAATKRESYVGMAHEATYFMTDLAMLVVPVSVDDPQAEQSPQDDWISRLGERLEPVEAGVKGKLGEWFGPPST